MILHISDDFDLEKIADSGQCFRWERLPDGSYRILHGDLCLYIERLGDKDYALSCSEAEFTSVWHGYFDLTENYRAIRGRIDPERDPFLFAAAEQEKGIRILRQSPWEMLITFIISQNRNIPAIRRSVEALCGICGEEKTDCRGNRYHAFPAADAMAALSGEQLKDCRLGYRCRFVHEAAAAVAEGKLDPDGLRDAPGEEACRRLMELSGVGIKVASCISLFGLHDLNSFPRDVWIKRILENEYPEGYPFDRYAPYNGVFQQYMFAYYRGKKQQQIQKQTGSGGTAIWKP